MIGRSCRGCRRGTEVSLGCRSPVKSQQSPRRTSERIKCAGNKPAMLACAVVFVVRVPGCRTIRILLMISKIRYEDQVVPPS
jgi:hypothetical protein